MYPTVPPRVEYRLTEPGQALRATVDGMCDWTQRHLGDIEESRRHFDA
ncbi:winged helix-turn-helix transcriptional regulator [Nocardia sp. NPDC058176]